MVEENGDLIHVGVSDLVGNESYAVEYYFERSMKCVKVEQSDKFAALHHKLESEGKLKHVPDAKYNENLKTGLLYWDSERFVNQAVMNKKHKEVSRK